MTEDERESAKIPMPAVLIVGDVVGLRSELKWFE
jgi:siroheme synthase